MLIPVFVFSQLNINITSNLIPLYPSDGDTLSGCRDSVIIFKAVVIDTGTGLPVTNAEYYWNFDDGTNFNGTDEDSVAHQFTNGGLYRVRLKVTDASMQEATKIKSIRIAVSPDYSKTKVDLPEDVTGICKSSSGKLLGKAFPVEWKDSIIYEVTEDPAKEISDITPYSSELFFNEFPEGTSYNPGDIDSIGIKSEHSDMGNLQIKLSCENGTSVILKDFDASNHAYLGEPIDVESSSDPGTPYMYYWSDSSSSGTINSTTLSPVPATAYLPEQSFDNFSGCPMNGTWTLDITDNQNTDNGFVFSWIIKFKKDIQPKNASFKDTLLQYKEINSIIYGTYWEGKNAGGTAIFTEGDTIKGTAFASPDVYGGHAYTFHVINNFGCPQDTSIILTVEKASATANPQNGEAKLDVAFENTTSWATEKEWNFGDKSPKELYLEEDTVSHKYLEKGTYDAVLKVSDNTGCTDYDTLTIGVTVEPSKLDVPNVFTPNDDGINDVFKFTEDGLKGMKEFHLTIYDRWGKKMYETYNPEEAVNVGWDGTNLLGIKASPGVYYYIITAEGKDGKVYKGDRGSKKKQQQTDENRVIEGTKGTIRLLR